MAKTNVEILLSPRGGLRLDLPGDLISPLEMTDCANIFFEDGLVKKRYGYNLMGNNLPLPGAILGFDQYYLFDGNSYLLVITTKGTFYWLETPDLWECLNEAEVEDDCETTWTAESNVTVADETTIKKIDSKSQRISPAKAFTTGLLAYHDTALGDKSAYGLVRLWIRSSIDLVAGDLQFVISNSAGGADPQEEIDLPALVADTWKIVILEIATPADIDSIDSLGINATRDFCVTGAITKFEDGDGGKVVVTSAAHGLSDDDVVNITGTTSYNGVFAIDEVTTDTFEITDTWVDNDATGDWTKGTIYIDDIQFVKLFSTDVEDEDLCSFDYIRKSTETDPWWILSNGVDVVKKWDGDTTGSILDLITAPAAGYTAKYVVEFKAHLLLLDVTGSDSNRYPQRILWSDTADPEDFEGGNASYRDLPGADWIAGAMKFKGDYLVIFKERSIWVGYATGDSDIFQFDCKVTGAGCAADKTIESLGDELIFLGWDDVYVFNGIDYEPIGTPIQRELFRTLNPEEMGRSFGVVVEEQKEYWLFVPSTGSTYPDIAWCFNYELNKWTKHTFSDYITMYGYYYLEASITWDDMTGSWQEQTLKWDDRKILKSAPTTLFGDSSGYVFQYDRLTNNDNNVLIDAYFCTKDFNFTQLTSRQRILRIDTYYTGNSLDVSYSTDKGKNWTAIGTLAASDNLEIPRSLFLRLDCNQVRFRFRNNTLSEHIEFSRANIYWQPAGGRLI